MLDKILPDLPSRQAMSVLLVNDCAMTLMEMLIVNRRAQDPGRKGNPHL
jgi:hypothetical protein